MIARLGSGWQTITADLALILFLITAASIYSRMLGLAGLPRAAAQTVQQTFLVAIARQQFDILDRQIEFGVACIGQLQTVVGRFLDVEGAPAFMFGLSTEYCTLGCGTFEFPKPMLERYRETIAGARGEELGKMIDGLIADGYRLNEPALKRVPAGFPADHPRAALSLHKGLALWRDFESSQSATEPDLMRKCLGHFETLLPFWRFLSAAG
mgnify:CR=1 FL=1